MKRFMKVLLGLSIGAAVAVLFAPKSGRELRQQLIGGATGKLLPAAPVEFPEPEGERLWDTGTATAVVEPPVEEPAYPEPQIGAEAVVGGIDARAAGELGPADGVENILYAERRALRPREIGRAHV